MRGIEMTAAQVEAFNRKHGHGAVIDKNAIKMPQVSVLPKDRMNKTEKSFSQLLEAQKRKGEIIEWRFEGITLMWGIDEKTGIPLRYTPDFWVIDNPFLLDGASAFNIVLSNIRLIEVKSAHIRNRTAALLRFRGCRSDWPMFRFELHQKTKLGWNRIE